ncbi:GntR family transcriptional regulator [Gordonia amicalis]|nr:GntR family transcriptional regulator [Gordonia amicalis]UOG23559.1 GntR family transcriptional regulator [Gordonia amicalis]
MDLSERPRVLKHQVVRSRLEELLEDLVEVDPFPAECELAESFSVSRETIRQALRELLLDGRIERRRRMTVVAGPKILQPLSIDSYTEAARERGMEAGRFLVGWTHMTADAWLAERLALSVGDPVLQLERVFTTAGVRIGLDTTRLPAHRYPDLEPDFEVSSSLYAEFARRGINFGRTEDTIETALPDAREAALLHVDARTPMFVLKRQSYDEHGVLIEFRRSLYRGDRMAFTQTMYPD